jgi:PilZ domain-containing protein
MSTKIPVSGGPEINSRRSQRVILALGVTVSSPAQGKLAAFQEETQTLVVNAHGCLISLSNKVEKGQLVLMKNRATQDEQSCKVVYVGGLANGKAQIGIEFTAPSPEFWHIAFPPEDWVPLERVPATRSDKKR